MFMMGKGFLGSGSVRDWRTATVGVMVPPDLRVEDVATIARHVESAGLDELWITEDCGRYGGFTVASAMLSETETLCVGLAIVPALVRNPVFLAMEIGTLCRLHPGRFLPGLGHGWQPWMESIGAKVASPLTALEEVITATRQLLEGRCVTIDGAYVQLRNVTLTHPPDYLPLLSLGVSKANSLELSGRVADGTVLPEGSSARYVSAAANSIHAGMRGCNRSGSHRITVISWCDVADDVILGCRRIRPVVNEFLASGALDAQLAALSVHDAQSALRGRSEVLSDDFIQRIALVGGPDHCLDGVARLAEAGADAVILRAATNQAHVELVERLGEYLSGDAESRRGC